MNPPSRASLRRYYRDARRALTPAQQREHANAVARHFAVSPLMLCCQRCAVYVPSDGELDPSPIAAHLLAANKVVALPVVERSRRLDFYRYDADTPFVRNRFDIPEPDTRLARAVPARVLDVVMLPLVAFDDTGNRMGRGGGYYDATFKVQRRTLLIGIGHELQHHHRLENREWDVPLDAVITEHAARGFTIRGRRFFAPPEIREQEISE